MNSNSCSADSNYEVTLMTKATVYYNGAISWRPPAIYKSSCAMDLHYFPYDAQTCFLKMGSWTYSGFQVYPSPIFDFPSIPKWRGRIQSSHDICNHYVSITAWLIFLCMPLFCISFTIHIYASVEN